MRRTPLIGVLAGALALASLLALQLGPAPAQADKQQPPATPAPAPAAVAPVANPSALPVVKVVLFTSGVGYFQREGEIDGSARVELAFPAANVNDLLKSLVLQDPGGQVSVVGYDSHDPMEKALKSFALDLTGNPSLAQLLQQARGEKVEVEWQGQQVVKGSVVGVEKQRQPAGKDQVVEVDVVNVLTADGLRSLPLNQVQRVRFANPALEGELRKALDVLAQSHDTQKKVVRLNFAGAARRSVRVGYVVETPIWKTSYRLVLDAQGKPFLQGWAIVDNATDEDWNNVAVTLVSGRPISFRMNLHQPLYVPRPLIEPELFASLRPPSYGGDVSGAGPAPAPPRARAEAERALRDQRKSAYGAAPGLAAPGGGSAPMDIRQGAPSVAQAGEVGELFQYAIKQAVSLPRQKSAMLPIVNRTVEGTRVSIYNAGVHAKHPLLGLQFQNATELHLMQGPVTVLDGGSYAGDARIPDLQPGEKRLLSYAVDQGTEVDPVAKSVPERLISVRVVRGILYATHKLQQGKVYTVKNRSTHERVVLLEHPISADWALVNPAKPAEKSREFYRFQVTVPPGKAVAQEVVEEKPRVTQVVLSNSDDQTIRLYLAGNVASAKVKAALEQAGKLKEKLVATQREADDLRRQEKAIVEDQARIRANMARVPEKSAPYQRYLKKLDEQEMQIERLQAQVRTGQVRENEQRAAFEKFLLSLDVE
jgi:hypothetical protein